MTPPEAWRSKKFMLRGPSACLAESSLTRFNPHIPIAHWNSDEAVLEEVHDRLKQGEAQHPSPPPVQTHLLFSYSQPTQTES